MGLPLYRAAVESDIKSKVPKDPPTRARSTIRRSRRNVNDSSPRPTSTNAHYYAHRVDLGPRSRITSPLTVDAPWTAWDNAESQPPVPYAPSATRRPAVPDPYPSSRDINTTQAPTDGSGSILHEVNFRSGPMSQEMMHFFGEQMARFYAGTSSRGAHDLEGVPETDEQERAFGSPDHEPSHPVPTARRALYTPRSTTDGESRMQLDLLRRQNELSTVRRTTVRMQQLPAMHDARAARARRSASGDAAQEPHPDGLGDRDRSLSPEGEEVWDTLLSSITPDPQPPSVGTSSTPASAAASQPGIGSGPTSASSSRTSLAEDAEDGYTADEIGFVEVCESGGDNSDMEGDGDEEAQVNNTLRRFGRSYADGQGRQGEVLELFGGFESMQRIVRNLARREDIPDEWWAEAGLSRTLGRDGS